MPVEILLEAEDIRLAAKYVINSKNNNNVLFIFILFRLKLLQRNDDTICSTFFVYVLVLDFDLV